jgi:predicted NodU family carbamoyl transferase
LRTRAKALQVLSAPHRSKTAAQNLHKNQPNRKNEKADESQYVEVRSIVVMLVDIDSSQIYATSEERKQRNRQAQAAFRERRTEYIKQLEATIKQNEETLSTLQQSHRSAADECLMLRYKNSLLERILLEKGKLLMNKPFEKAHQR